MIDAKFKLGFFDSKAVIKATDQAQRRVLSKAGSFIWKTAKRSIRKRKSISDPGDPPRSHSGELRRFIFFAFDFQSESVVVGPAPFKQGKAPNLLEFGGKARIRRRRKGKLKKMRANYKPRPFMGPAFDEELPQFPQLFKNSVGPGQVSAGPAV